MLSMHYNCHLGVALRSTSRFSAVFVGEVELCPGVKFTEYYKYLSDVFRKQLIKRNIKVIQKADGIQLEDDRIHWKGDSWKAVQNLMRNLVEGKLSSKMITGVSPPSLWKWVYNDTWGKHFPFCSLCHKTIDAAHLTGHTHQKEAAGSAISFDRAKSFIGGVTFFVDGDRKKGTDKTPFLSADHPMPTCLPCAQTELVAISVDLPKLTKEEQQETQPRTGLPKEFQATIFWNNGEKTTDIFGYHGQGMSRGFYKPENPTHKWGFKVQIIESSRRNRPVAPGDRDRNEIEYAIYQNNEPLRRILPEVYGYFTERYDYDEHSSTQYKQWNRSLGVYVWHNSEHFLVDAHGTIDSSPRVCPEGNRSLGE